MRPAGISILLPFVFALSCAEPPPIEGAICPCPAPGYKCCDALQICLAVTASCDPPPSRPTPATPLRVMIQAAQTGRQGEVRFHGTCEPGPCSEFFWDFEDGGMSNLQSPTHLFGQPGSYRVTLKAFASNGAAGFDFNDVVVSAPDPDLDPGGDPTTGPTPDPQPPKPACRPTAGTNLDGTASQPQICP